MAKETKKKEEKKDDTAIEKRLQSIQGSLSYLKKEVKKIKRVLKDAHIMSLDA